LVYQDQMAADGTVAAEDCSSIGTFTSLGYNLVQEPGAICDSSAIGDFTGLDPNLFPVGDLDS